MKRKFRHQYLKIFSDFHKKPGKVNQRLTLGSWCHLARRFWTLKLLAGMLNIFHSSTLIWLTQAWASCSGWVKASGKVEYFGENCYPWLQLCELLVDSMQLNILISQKSFTKDIRMRLLKDCSKISMLTHQQEGHSSPLPNQTMCQHFQDSWLCLRV